MDDLSASNGAQAIAAQHTILRGLVGSSVHGVMLASTLPGCLPAQKQAMLGQRGGHRPTRPELVEAHGHDTKFAGHVLRLGYQGVEFLESGRITLPMPEPQRQRVLAVRRGEVPLN